MNDTLKQFTAGMPLSQTLFPPTSRYHGIETDALEETSSRKVVYLKRRFIPSSNEFALLQEHTVVASDRLDNLAHRYLEDAEQFWRICDANNAIRPEELTETVGRKIRITLPQGIPGTIDA